MTDLRSMSRVLVVDEDPTYVHLINELLHQEGYETDDALTGLDALARARARPPDLVLLDIGLPDLSGIEVCRRLRTFTDTPVIFLTGRTEDLDKVTALDAGGDDYLVKPFSLSELAARLRALLRRGRPSDPETAARLEVSGVVLQVAARRAFVRGVETSLTRREFDLLKVLLANAGRTVGRPEIFDTVWGQNFFGDRSTLDTYIGKLRLKIELDPRKPRLIQTVRGVGFRFTNSS